MTGEGGTGSPGRGRSSVAAPQGAAHAGPAAVRCTTSADLAMTNVDGTRPTSEPYLLRDISLQTEKRGAS
jgi:hypothetical protein